MCISIYFTQRYKVSKSFLYHELHFLFFGLLPSIFVKGQILDTSGFDE